VRAASWLALSLLLVLASLGSVDGKVFDQVAKASLKSRGKTGATEATDEDVGSEEEVDNEEELEHEEGDHDLDDDDDDHEDEMLKDDALEHEDDDAAADEEGYEDDPDLAKNFMEEADLNKDGKISLMELHQAMDGEQGSEDNATTKVDDSLKSELAHFHAEADHNKDGLVDVAELPALLQRLHEQDEDYMDGDDTEEDEEDDAGEDENNDEVGEEDEEEDRDAEEDDEKAEENKEEENQEDE